MKIRKTLSKNIVFVALALAVIGRLVVSYPLNTNLLEGTDFTAHIPKIWYLANEYEKYGEWNPYWYGGYPIFKYYSPLSYYMAGFLAFFMNDIIAYKIVINVFFLLAPIVFYLFIRDFKLSNAQKAVGILVFSFFITNIYYFWNNAFPTLVNMPFLILTWLFAKKFAEGKGKKSLVFASLFVGLSILIHQLTAFFNLLLIFSWILIKYRKILILPIMLGSLISSFWLFPFLFEFEKSVIRFPEISGFINNIIYHIGFSGLILLSAFLFGLSIFSFREKTEKHFLAILAIILLVVLFSQQYRIIALIPIPLAVFIAQIYNKKIILPIFALIIVFAVLFYSYHAFSFSGHEAWEVPSAESRIIYLPPSYEFCLPEEKCYKFSYSSYLPLKKNQQIINGWFQESQRIGKLKNTKDPYLEKISRPLEMQGFEYYSLLKAGFVNTVVVNKFYPEYVSYFSNSTYFKKINESEHFIVFELNPIFSYVEINGLPINYSIIRGNNKISLKLDCYAGNLTIKESYDINWKLYLNNKQIDYDVNEYGFIKTKINKKGKCEVIMNYQKNMEFLPLSLLFLLLITFIRLGKK